MNTEFVHILNQASVKDKDGKVEDYVLYLNGNKRNESNEMYRKKITDNDLIPIITALKCNNFVVGIDLSYNNINDNGVCLIATYLQDTATLQTLVLSYNDIHFEGVKSIANALQFNRSLLVLVLDGNKFGPEGGTELANVLQVNSTLEKLSLNNTDQNMTSLVNMTAALHVNKVLKILDVTRPLLFSQQEELAIHFGNLLKNNSFLFEVHLGKHGIKDYGAERFIDLIMENKTLLHLDLSCNRICRDGVKFIANYLATNPPLQVLNLAYNKAEDDGAIALSEAISVRNTSLVTLVICHNSILGEGLCSLARSLRSNYTLKQLYIWGNQTDQASCQAFLELTCKSPTRLNEKDTDVMGYVVDGVPYLAKLSSPF